MDTENFLKYIRERWINTEVSKMDDSDAHEYAVWLFENNHDDWTELTSKLDYSEVCESIHSNDYEKLCQIDRLEKDYLYIMKCHLIGLIVAFRMQDEKNDFDQKQHEKDETTSFNNQR